MKALVTGASGFVGGHLVRALLDAGWEVTTLDARPRPGIPGVRSIIGDLASVRLPASLRADAIFHLAGIARPAECEEDPRRAFAVNAAGAARLARQAPKGARFLFVSTADVYGRAKRIPTPEDERPRPSNAYAASKLCAESLLSPVRDLLVLRPFNHTGPGQARGFVAPDFASQIAAAEAGRQPPVLRVINRSPVRDFLDVRDVVRAYLLAFEKAPPGTYNIASGEGTRVGDLLEMLLGLARVRLRVVEDAERRVAGDPDVRVGDASRFRAATGWSPQIPLRKTLSDLLDFERARPIVSPA